MLATYACAVIVLGCATIIGAAVLALGGRRSWSWLAPAIGLAALVALSWATVRLPGEGLAALIAIALLTAVAAACLAGSPDRAGRPGRPGPAPRLGAPVIVAAALAASLPFIVEMRFGILGTGLNPDMSQHLFAVDALANGEVERLIAGGYPLGPHALVTGLSRLGPSAVHAFDGLMIAVAVATCLAALVPLGRLGAWRAVTGALLVGFAYLLASNYVQGAFKEALEALFVLAFAIGLGGLASAARADPRGGVDRRGGRWGGARRALPLAVIAIGAVYAYSFPGLLWLAGALGAWALIELGRAGRDGGAAAARDAVRAAAPAALLGLLVVVIAIAPEIGRLVDFASFETFDPDGAGLGNLFDRLSPLEVLGIWPSGDFRVEPGDGAIPAIVFYLGAALGAGALGFALRRHLRRGALAVPAALAAAAVLWLYALVAGTPYQEAKALVIAAPVVAMISVRGLLAAAPAPLVALFVIAAGGSSALALVNGPVGPGGYSPALASVRAELGPGSTLVIAPPSVLDSEHGRDFIGWELRGHRICIEPSASPPRPVPPGIATTVSIGVDEDGALVPSRVEHRSPPPPGPGPCPLISTSGRADPGGAGG